MRAKKSLGQNFLKSEMALRKIAQAGEIKQSDVILEIGPGKGALTEKLLEKFHPAQKLAGQGKVIAIEKDPELVSFLKNKFKKEIETGTLILVCKDILDFEIEIYLAVRSPNALGDRTAKLRNYKLIANIPYNITGAILKKFLTAKHQPESMVLMIQHEVAKRILGNSPACAKASAGKKESVLSISVKAYGEPKIIMKVPARYFSPSPKVDSAVIVIKNISRKIFKDNDLDENRFWEIVRAGFAHKRKKLGSNLKNLRQACQGPSLTGLKDKRAEDLSLADWILLAKRCYN